MPVSADIYGMVGRGVQPVEDPQNALLKALKLQGAQQEMQQQRELGTLKMDEYRRGVDRSNKLQQLLAGDYADDESRAGALVKGGFLDEGQKVLKNRADLNKQNIDLDAKRLEMASKRLELAGQGFGWLKDNPSAENAISVIDSFGQNGIWNPQQVAKAKADVMANPTPENVARLATMGYQSALSAKDQLPSFVQQGRGGTVATQRINPVTGKVDDVQSATVTQTEAQRLQLAQQADEAAKNRGVQIRGQNMADARSRDANLQASKAPAGYRYKPDGTMEAIPGGPADLKNTAGTVAKVTDAQDVLSLLDQAEPLLDKSTNSYTGAAIDEVGRAFGGATGGARAAAQLRALEGALIAKMPKMSGPQSDKDVLLYKQMAGQIGDRTIPAEQKRAAMQTIREINNRHAGTVPKPAGALSPEDAQAREWATKNPNDPRAKQIMQRLGGG